MALKFRRGCVIFSFTFSFLRITIAFDRGPHNCDYVVRPKIIKVAKTQLKDVLKSYMIRPVIRSVEMDEPLEHLTEMRQVVIVFINVITTDVDKKKLISLVNEAFKMVCE